MKVRVEVDGQEYEVTLRRAPNGLELECGGETLDVHLIERGPPLRLESAGATHQVSLADDEHAIVDGARVRYHVAGFEPGPAVGADLRPTGVAVQAMMPGRIVRLLVAKGAPVEKGRPLLVLEAMKMQNELQSPTAGRVRELLVAEGDTVETGRVLVRLDPA